MRARSVARSDASVGPVLQRPVISKADRVLAHASGASVLGLFGLWVFNGSDALRLLANYVS